MNQRRPINKDRFFKDLASKAMLDESTCKKVYYSMIKILMEYVRKHNYAALPDLGIFGTKMIENILFVGDDGRAGRRKARVPIRVLKFLPCKPLKYYVKNMKVMFNENEENG